MTPQEFIARFDSLTEEQNKFAVGHFIGAMSFVATELPDEFVNKQTICEALDRSIESAQKFFPA